jgi:hypothetical protein
LGRDETCPAGKKCKGSGTGDAGAVIRYSSAGFFPEKGEQFRIPERLQKKIDRVTRMILRAGERRGWT